jgi:hypothetical protein
VTTKRTFECNFCRGEIPPEDGLGLLWKGTELEARPMREVENHLCRLCGKALLPVLSNLFTPTR